MALSVIVKAIEGESPAKVDQATCFNSGFVVIDTGVYRAEVIGDGLGKGGEFSINDVTEGRYSYWSYRSGETSPTIEERVPVGKGVRRVEFKLEGC